MSFKVEYQRNAFKPGYPLHQDFISMGTPLGMNVMVLHHKFPSERWTQLKLVNTETGEALLITLDDKFKYFDPIREIIKAKA